MKVYSVLSLLLAVFLLLGCQESPEEKPQHNRAKISKPLQQTLQQNGTPVATASNTATPQQQRAAHHLSPLGIEVDDGRIIIDTKQTKAFLQEIGQQMNRSLKRIEKNLRKEQIHSAEETGIIITDTSIQVDLNQTRHFMERWIRSMESVAKEIDHTMKEIEKSLP